MHEGQHMYPAAIDSTDARATVLLLVRCWLEPHRGANPALRGYVRDLRTGREIPIADLRSIENQVRSRLRLPAQEQQQDERRLTV